MEYLLTKYTAEKPHAEQVKKISLLIFDKMKQLELHNLSDKKRKMLEIGSYLHDIGYFVESKGHNKHSSKLIKAEKFEGMDDEDISIISCIARYHRGSLPHNKHSTYASLIPKKQKTVRKLAGIARLADALDSLHSCLISDIEFTYSQKQNILWARIIPQNFDSKLDLYSAICKKDLFEKAFKLQLIMVLA